jgi:hypothetical protein
MNFRPHFFARNEHIIVFISLSAYLNWRTAGKISIKLETNFMLFDAASTSYVFNLLQFVITWRTHEMLSECDASATLKTGS